VDKVLRWCNRDNLRDVAPPNEVIKSPIEIVPAKDLSRPIKIVATVLCGNNEGIVEEAVRSVVDWVDEVCLIDTGIHDSSAKRVRDITQEKYTEATFAWCGDFAAARNSALVLADQCGATWALTLDTDERMVFHGFKDREHLRQQLGSDSDVQAWLVPCQDGHYSKERFIKIPASVRWKGATHEALNCEHPSHRRILPDCYFWELAKDEHAFEQKLLRDLEILKQTTRNNPLDPRWWYYLGQTYEGLRQWRSAVRALSRCIRLDGWPDESAWACYLAASCLCHLKEYREAEEYCALGMSRKPNAVELPWLASWCCLERCNYAMAIQWAGIAIGINIEQNSPRGDDSVAGFRHLPAWFEAPYDVLRFAYRHTNQIEKAEHAERMYQSELLKRQKMFCQHPAGEN
jgi:tetratricopeptide (TPR) repeat protein